MRCAASQLIYRLCLLAIFPLSGCVCESCHGSCNLRTPKFLPPTVLKHHGLSSVCLRYRLAPRAFISCTAVHVSCSHMLTAYLCYLPRCPELKQPRLSLNTLITPAAVAANSITTTHNFSCALLCAGFHNATTPAGC